jgi:hypothetical protein
VFACTLLLLHQPCQFERDPNFPKSYFHWTQQIVIYMWESSYKIFRLRLRSGFFIFFWWEVQSSRRFVTETRQRGCYGLCERERKRDRACTLTRAKSMQILSLGPCTWHFFLKWQNTKETLLVINHIRSFFLSFFPIWALVLHINLGSLFPFQFVAGADSYYNWW